MKHRSMRRLQMGRQGNAEVSAALENAIQSLDHLARILEMTPRMRATFALSPEQADKTKTLECSPLWLTGCSTSTLPLARAIVDTVREPFLVLDRNLRIVSASRSFYTIFQIEPEETQGKMLYELSRGEWDIAALRLLLGRIVPASEVMEDFEVEQSFPRIGRRTMVLNAHKVFDESSRPPTILLAFEDITERRTVERMLKSLLAQKEMLLAEMSHRVANSLQIIASILLMKARSVQSDETRQHLEDAHRRVISVASVQQHLQASGNGGQIEVGPYLSSLCGSLAASMIGDHRPVTVKVVAGGGMAISVRP